MDFFQSTFLSPDQPVWKAGFHSVREIRIAAVEEQQGYKHYRHLRQDPKPVYPAERLDAVIV